jgi:hypothetical protein
MITPAYIPPTTQLAIVRYVPPGRRDAPAGTQGGGTRFASNAEGFVFTPKPNPVPRQTRGSGTRFQLSTSVPRIVVDESPKTSPKGPKISPKLRSLWNIELAYRGSGRIGKESKGIVS